MHLRLLGPGRAESAGQAVRLPDRKAMALLAVVALEGSATRARLASLLWDEQGESDARRNLRRVLHRLRDAGLEPWLAGQGDVLALAAAVQVDVVAFQQALQAGEHARALLLHAAPLLHGFDISGAPAFDDWLAAHRAELAQRWRAAAEAHAQELQARAQPRAALAVATRLLEQDTLHEAHYRRAMALHAELGEREAALALYERCRQTLGRELGLKPLADTLALAERIRAGAALPAPVLLPTANAAPAVRLLQALPAVAPLVGRGPIIDTLRQALAERRLAVLRAAPGLGKTRVLRALAGTLPHARLHESRIGDKRVPYAAWVRWLRAGIQDRATPRAGERAGERAPQGTSGPLAASPWWQHLPAWVRLELARLLPELGAPPAPLQTDAQRLRLFEALREAWQACFEAGAGAPGVMLFDDWQFVDEASAMWWGWWLGQAHGAAGTAVLVAERPGEALAEAASVLGEALTAAAAPVVELPPLPASAVYGLVKELSGTRDPQRFSHRLAQATGGHPFYVLETLQHLLHTGVIRADEQGQWHTPFDDATHDYGELPIAPSVQAAVQQRLHALPEATQRLLQAASLTGDDFSLALAAAASALDEWEAVRALEAALAARVLARDEHQPGHFHFEHDLFAQAVAAELQPERRALMHRALAQHLVREGGAAAAPARVAAHFDAAGDSMQALAWHARALAQAQRGLVLADMLVHADRLLALGADVPQALHAHLARASALRMLARPQAADEALGSAAAALAPLGAAAPRALRVALAQAQAFHGMRAGRVEEALARLQALLEDPLLEPEQRAHLLVRRANCQRAVGLPDESHQDLMQALSLFGDEPSVALGDLLDDLSRTAASRGDNAACLQYATRALHVMEQCDYPAGMAAAMLMQAVAHLYGSRYDAALPPLLRSREIASRHGFISAERGAILNLASLYLHRCERQAAMQVVDEGYALSSMFTGASEQQAFIEARYQCRVEAGELGAALAARPALVRYSVAVSDTDRRQSGLLVSLDLPLMLGDIALAEEAVELLLLDIDAGRECELRGQGLAKAAWWRLLRGDAPGALHLAERAAQSHLRPDDEHYVATLRIQAHLALGDVPGARACAARVLAGGSGEVRARHLAAQLRAFVGDAAAAAPHVSQAHTMLAADEPPPLESLELAQALDLHGQAAQWEEASRRCAQRLHASLTLQPAQRSLFEQRHARWLAAQPGGDAPDTATALLANTVP